LLKTDMSDRDDLWSLMTVPREALGRGTTVRVRVGGDAEALARDMAEEMAGVIRDHNREERPTCLIVPVGPVGQYAHLARIIAEEPLDCARVTFVAMDEFLDDEGGWIDPRHPLSFRGFLEREFYDRLPPSARFRVENRLCPDPRYLEGIAAAIADRDGVDVAFGGIGLNGHLAFNEPEDVPAAVFAARTTRAVTIAPESRAHMAVNLSCALDLIPRRAATIGMREILGARRVSLYANRPWQRGVVRLALHGPVSPSCPASLIQRHRDATITVASDVAEPVEARLR
jgi:glucosamine-6-phosphate deaminase